MNKPLSAEVVSQFFPEEIIQYGVPPEQFVRRTRLLEPEIFWQIPMDNSNARKLSGGEERLQCVQRKGVPLEIRYETEVGEEVNGNKRRYIARVVGSGFDAKSRSLTLSTTTCIAEEVILPGR